MDRLQVHQDICRQFAALLSYPDAEVQTTAITCQQSLQINCSESAPQLQKFVEYLASTDQARVKSYLPQPSISSRFVIPTLATSSVVKMKNAGCF